MHVLGQTKDRFDTLKRQIEAERDEDLRNSDVLDLLMDDYQNDAGDAGENSTDD